MQRKNCFADPTSFFTISTNLFTEEKLVDITFNKLIGILRSDPEKRIVNFKTKPRNVKILSTLQNVVNTVLLDNN